MFEIPDDDLFNEDNLREILNEGDLGHPNEVVAKESVALCRPVSSQVRTDYESCLRSPQNKRQRVLMDANHLADELNILGGHSNADELSTAAPDSYGRLPVQNRRRSLRKFPGPAGILPLAKPAEPVSQEGKGVETEAETTVKVHTDTPEECVSGSQCGDDALRGGAWQSLLADLEPGARETLTTFSVRTMLHKARRRLLPKGKVPLLFGLVDSLDFQSTDPAIILRDPTGQMQGTLHREVFKDFRAHLQVGAALVLRQVSVISPSPRTHYLNITAGNIVAVYPAGDSCLPTFLPPGPLSQQTVKSYVSVAELELLQAANTAKEMAASRLSRQRLESSPTPLPGGSQSAVFRKPAPHPPGDNASPLFTSHWHRASTAPRTPNRPLTFTTVNASSPVRPPSSLGAAAPLPHSITATEVGRGTVVCGQRLGIRNQAAASIVGTASPGQPTPPVASQQACLSASGGLYSIDSAAGVAGYSNSSAGLTAGDVSRLGKESCSGAVGSHSQYGTTAQHSKWTFKRKSVGSPAEATFAGSSHPVNTPLSEQRASCTLQDQRTFHHHEQLGVGGSNTNVISSVGNSTTSVSSKQPAVCNFWDDELSDDILSQLSDDF